LAMRTFRIFFFWLPMFVLPHLVFSYPACADGQTARALALHPLDIWNMRRMCATGGYLLRA